MNLIFLSVLCLCTFSMSELEQSEEFFLLAVDDSSRKIRFESIHSSREVVCLDSFGFCERAGLWWSSTRSADEDHLFCLIDFIHPEWEEMEWDIACRRDMDFCIFSCSSDIDEIYFFWRFVEKGSEFFGGNGKHSRWNERLKIQNYKYCHIDRVPSPRDDEISCPEAFGAGFLTSLCFVRNDEILDCHTLLEMTTLGKIFSVWHSRVRVFEDLR